MFLRERRRELGVQRWTEMARGGHFAAMEEPELLAADIRTWDNLPRYLSFASFPLPPGEHTATVEFLGPQGNVMPGLTKTININVANIDHDTVVFVSDASLTPQSI